MEISISNNIIADNISNKTKRISFLQPSSVYSDLSCRLLLPRYGVVAIATILHNKGYETRVFAENSANIDWDYVYSSDYVCFSIMSASATKAYKYMALIRSKSQAPIITGGTHQ